MTPLPMRDLRPQLGDRLLLVDYGEHGVECTVIAHDTRDVIKPYLVGWKKEESGLARPYFTLTNFLVGSGGDPRIIPNCKCITGITQYEYNQWLGGSTKCITVRAQSGMTCAGRYCRTYNPYAQPNMPDGTYVCYSCRQKPECLR